MKCPFLRNTSVESCEATAFRKMIARESTDTDAERCSSTAWRECPAASGQAGSASELTRCPFLHDAQVEFCSAASVTKYVPATNDLVSCCHTDGHLYCELFLAHADPVGDRRPKPHGTPAGVHDVPLVDGIPVPPHLFYSPNHMWLDIAGDGYCHVGIDGFAAKVIGRADRVTFVTPRGHGRPAAVLRVNGVDVSMVFPNGMHVTSTNAYLRTAPQKITSDPYGAGWLFEGVDTEWTEGACKGLIGGREAVSWMASELEHLNSFVHERVVPSSGGAAFMADGGVVEDALAASLDREQLIGLITEFFAAQLTWRRSW